MIDASVLTDFLLGRPEAHDTLRREMSGNEHQPLHAPEVIEPETLNALRRLTAGGHVTGRRASEALFDLANMRLLCYPHAPLRERVWDLRHNLTAYDASYLALAEALAEAALLTGDAGLAQQARMSLGDDRVHQVS